MRLRTVFICLILAAAFPLLAQTGEHSDRTITGVHMRTYVDTGIEGVNLGPVMLQDMDPCTLVSTLTVPTPVPQLGEPVFTANEYRTYQGAGVMDGALTSNPCSRKIPDGVTGITVRLFVKNPVADGSLYVTPAAWGPYAGLKAFDFKAGVDRSEEVLILLSKGRFWVAMTGGGGDVVVEVIGYFEKDSFQDIRGSKGDIGPMGPQGPAGSGADAYGVATFNGKGEITIDDPAILDGSMFLATYIKTMNNMPNKPIIITAQEDGHISLEGNNDQSFRWILINP